ncbi:MAG: hypothetical protein HC880_09175 [Bacteroidia bacterium]|nr:hypothetical protein [Bacteroidia bacterium]
MIFSYTQLLFAGARLDIREGESNLQVSAKRQQAPKWREQKGNNDNILPGLNPGVTLEGEKVKDQE